MSSSGNLSNGTWYVSTQSTPGLWQLLEDDEDKLLGEADSKDGGGAGERLDVLLISSVWHEEKERDTKSEIENTET